MAKPALVEMTRSGAHSGQGDRRDRLYHVCSHYSRVIVRVFTCRYDFLLAASAPVRNGAFIHLDMELHTDVRPEHESLMIAAVTASQPARALG